MPSVRQCVRAVGGELRILQAADHSGQFDKERGMMDIQIDKPRGMGGSPQLKAEGTLFQRILNAVRARIPGVQAVDYPVTGVDVSYWQGAIDWAKLATMADFAFIRAGYGNAEVDTRLTPNRDGATAYGVPFGLYWYCKPDKAWDKHADAFYNAWKVQPGKLPPVIDVEENGGLDKSALENWLFKLVTRFEGNAGVPLMIYTSAGFWNANMPLTNWAKNRKLWVANWTTGSAPLLPNEWAGANNPRTWEFWQYSARGNGADYGVQSTYIDLNRYHFSAAQFNADYGAAVEPPAPPPPPEPSDLIVPIGSFTVSSSYRNLRAGTGTDAPVIGKAVQGSVLPYVAEEGEWVTVLAKVWKASNE